MFARVTYAACDSWSAPSVALLGLDSGAFAALGSEQLRIAGIGVAPAEVAVQASGQHNVVGVV